MAYENAFELIIDTCVDISFPVVVYVLVDTTYGTCGTDLKFGAEKPLLYGLAYPPGRTKVGDLNSKFPATERVEEAPCALVQNLDDFFVEALPGIYRC